MHTIRAHIDLSIGHSQA